MNTFLRALIGLSIFSLTAATVAAADFEVSLVVEVRDENEQPLKDAPVTALFRVRDTETGHRGVVEAKDRTDAAGMARFQERTYGHVEVEARYPGYYPSAWSMRFRRPALRLPLRLRPICDPVPMIAHEEIRLPIPEGAEPLMLDMVLMDWLPPYGAGHHADIELVLTSSYTQYDQFQFLLALQFPGEGNGLQAIQLEPAERRSAFLSDYEAPENGYRDTALFEHSEGVDPTEGTESGSAFYFRIRGAQDEEGVFHGYYGRFHGPVVKMSAEGAVFMLDTLFINPRRNSRNMERDPSEQVTELAASDGESGGQTRARAFRFRIR